MATRKNHNSAHSTHKKPQTHAQPAQNGGDYYNDPPTQRQLTPRRSIGEPHDLSEAQRSLTEHNGFEYQLMPVEIEKEAEIGLVLGQIEGEKWVFVDEILPNGMIDMHGTIKEGDYLIQAGVYNLVGVDIATALELVERAYQDGRKSLSFVAARQQKSDVTKNPTNHSTKNHRTAHVPDREGSRAGPFVESKNDGDYKEPPKLPYSKKKVQEDDTRF